MHVVEDGNHFQVLVFETHVVKIPRTDEKRDELSEIVDIQNYLADNVAGILPVERYGDVLVMPRAPGTRADEIRDQWPYIRDKRTEIFEAVNELGYVLIDIGQSDIFYDESDDQVYIVDFSQLKTYDEVYG